jgi:hypothetical protein
MANHVRPSNVVVGQRFGKLIVTVTPETPKMTDACTCQCDCGTTKQYQVHNLVGGMSTSCGCSSSNWGSRNLLGKKFGRLTVVGQSFRQGKRRYWPCSCECGNTVHIVTNRLLSGHTKSCGCLKIDMGGQNETHGLSKNGKLTPEYRLWLNAKRRALKKNVRFDLEISDIVIPTHCPLLGIPLKTGSGFSPDTASVDEVIPGLGYTPTNFQIISWRANTIKSDATIQELEMLVANLKIQCERLNERTSHVDDAIVQSHGNTTVSGK